MRTRADVGASRAAYPGQIPLAAGRGLADSPYNVAQLYTRLAESIRDAKPVSPSEARIPTWMGVPSRGVIGAAMAEAGVVGLGRLTLSRRERMIAVEPRGTGMVLFMLRAADEVRAAQFGGVERDLDAEMVAIARAITVSGPEVSIRPRIETVTRRPCAS